MTSRSGQLEFSPEETKLKTYHCSSFRQFGADGYLIVTNKRVILHGHSSNSRIVEEVELNTVSGLSTYYGGRVLWNRVALGIFLALTALIMLISLSTSSLGYYAQDLRSILVYVCFILFIAAMLILISCYRKAFHLEIYSSQATGAPIRIGAGPNGIIGSGALLSLVAEPTEETDQMMLELGALIQDLKTIGDHAIERWQKKWAGRAAAEKAEATADLLNNSSSPRQPKDSQEAPSPLPYARVHKNTASPVAPSDSRRQGRSRRSPPSNTTPENNNPERVQFDVDFEDDYLE